MKKSHKKSKHMKGSLYYLFAFGLEAMPFGERRYGMGRRRLTKRAPHKKGATIGSLPFLIGHKELWNYSSRGKKGEMRSFTAAKPLIVSQFAHHHQFQYLAIIIFSTASL